MSKDQQTFRMPRWMTGTLAGLALVTGVGGILLVTEWGLDPISLTVATVGFLLAIGALDALRTRITLDGEEIIIVRGFRRRRLFRGHIDAVRWTRRRGIALLLDDGMWVRLPDVGGGQPCAAAIRAWVEHARRTEELYP